MTNTLHRYGNAESFRDDYIIIALPSFGTNDEGSLPKLKQFLRICAKHNPSNLGNGRRGGIAPEKDLGPVIHWKRPTATEWGKVIEGLQKPGMVSAVFASADNAIDCLQDIVKADLGISVNMSTSVENARRAAESCGVKRHSIEYTLGFNDPHDHLPDSQVLGLSTMCGHGMVSFNLAKKMIDMVREGRRTPEEAASTLVRFCPCGIFNPDRAIRLLKEACKEQR